MNNGNYIVLYSGTLDILRGVDILLDAIRYITRWDVQIWITGSGQLESRVREEAERNPKRISFLGFLPREQFVSVLQQSDICINPQPIDLEISKYCFPSKVLEYLFLGKVVITSRVSDLESYLKDYVLFLDEVRPKAIAENIEEVLDRFSELSEKARKGSEFLRESLTVKNQAQLLERFLSTIL